VLVLLVLGPISPTVSAFSSVTGNASNSFSAAASFCSGQATAAFVSGFETGTLPTGTGLWTLATAGGTPVTDSSVKRNGTYSLKIAKTTGNSNVSKAIPGTPNTAAARVAIRFATLPAANVSQLVTLQTTGGNSPTIYYYTATQKLALKMNGSTAIATSTVAAGTWYVIDMTADIASNPRTANWSLDGVDMGGVSSAEVGSTVSDLRIGSGVSGDAFTANYDDAIVSATASDYPIGDGKVVALRTTGQGTHNGVAGVVVNEDDSAIGAGSPARLADDPMTSTATYLKQTATGASAYAELTFADTADTCFNGVQATAATHSSAASGTNNAKAVVASGAASTSLFTNINGTSLKYATSIVTPPAGPWSQSGVNALVAQAGYATSVSTVPYWDAFVVEVDVKL
jgi:hypothetical protein